MMWWCLRCKPRSTPACQRTIRQPRGHLLTPRWIAAPSTPHRRAGTSWVHSSTGKCQAPFRRAQHSIKWSGSSRTASSRWWSSPSSIGSHGRFGICSIFSSFSNAAVCRSSLWTIRWTRRPLRGRAMVQLRGVFAELGTAAHTRAHQRGSASQDGKRRMAGWAPSLRLQDRRLTHFAGQGARRQPGRSGHRPPLLPDAGRGRDDDRRGGRSAEQAGDSSPLSTGVDALESTAADRGRPRALRPMALAAGRSAEAQRWRRGHRHDPGCADS